MITHLEAYNKMYDEYTSLQRELNMMKERGGLKRYGESFKNLELKIENKRKDLVKFGFHPDDENFINYYQNSLK